MVRGSSKNTKKEPSTRRADRGLALRSSMLSGILARGCATIWFVAQSFVEIFFFFRLAKGVFFEKGWTRGLPFRRWIVEDGLWYRAAK
ncbi:hypothetical protein CEXT_542091 [Caerostris extrusa]|uniref:Uncharacterized protein n=1 Tax=Caerostris extrusa TaxID=172846 RepID=A0AAV4PD10_CAEEX|nr:hypothetical protein CEXT_542091 [Caerostris extrusa]